PVKGGDVIMFFLRGITGAVVGGIVGFFIFRWLLSQGFYAMMLPGALLGLGCGSLSGKDSLCLGILAGIMALALGVFCEWQTAPWESDSSLIYFMTNFYRLQPVTLLMIVLGSVFGFWFGKGRSVPQIPSDSAS
ncbi:MAG: hypothetical protein AAGA30_12750, partial [Planctomycetota bacterium]